MAAILAKQPVSWAVLVANGVPKRDCVDIAPGVLLGAWRSIRRSMFQPDLAEPTLKVLRYGNSGIAWKHAGHYVLSAWTGPAMLCPEPLGLLLLLRQPGRACTRRSRLATYWRRSQTCRPAV